MSVNRKDEAICSETSLLAIRLDDFVKGVGVGLRGRGMPSTGSHSGLSLTTEITAWVEIKSRMLNQ